MAHFPATLAFSGILKPLRFEADIVDLEVEGEVPSQLNGSFHRVHPDQQFPPMFDNDQFFNGDGMISLFRFRNGKVDFKQRFAQTDKFKLERQAGKALFGAYRNPLTDTPEVKGSIRGTANIIGEFPRMDDRYATQKHTYGWLLVTDRSMPFNGPSGRASGLLLNKLGFIDFSTGKQSEWYCGPDSAIQEPCFVPRTPTAPEGDGYLIALVDDIVRNYSELLIVEAMATGRTSAN